MSPLRVSREKGFARYIDHIFIKAFDARLRIEVREFRFGNRFAFFFAVKLMFMGKLMS